MWDGVDRRRFGRAEYPCLITLRKTTPPPEAILTHTADVGIGGVRAIVSKKIEVKTEVDLELDLKDTLPTMLLKGVVNRVEAIPATRPGKPPRYDIGIYFKELKDEDRHRIQNIVKRLKERGLSA
jgi:hypothetical protein